MQTSCIRRILSRHATIGTPTVIFAVLTVFWLFLTIGTLLLHCWYRLGRHVMIGTPTVIFAVLSVFWLFLTFGTLLLHCWYKLGRHVTIGTPMSFLLFLLSFDCFDDWYTVGKVLVDM